MQLWKAALLRREEEETLDQEDPMSRPQQLWADVVDACDQTTDIILLLPDIDTNIWNHLFVFAYPSPICLNFDPFKDRQNNKL